MEIKKVESHSTTTLWSRSFLLLLFGNFFIYQGILMLIPAFSLYIKQIGGNDLEASLPFAVISISALIVRSISGTAADAFGRRPLLIIGMCILIAFNCSYFVASGIGKTRGQGCCFNDETYSLSPCFFSRVFCSPQRCTAGRSWRTVCKSSKSVNSREKKWCGIKNVSGKAVFNSEHKIRP